ncbi:N-acetylglucosaminyl-phosphatidylinositol de-N-acetylase-like isoform X2 [Carex littledalei]|uniref:N-acetylglucosaminylphosphatidylinositol deacetylase n=1 Tax=Carex littledalei TaxID=544730 RepID=A0A833V477_9POAL|nr:N-acetylglucosaminyl-phosphatidylinositol de-N-acetylase-like isoform X2 [Carex littledalei]
MGWIWPCVALIVSIWVASVLKIASSSSRLRSEALFLSSSLEKKKNVLLVMAHPDDESMFFSPTIMYLASEGHQIHLLCISVGNADGLGNTRRQELYGACTVFNIPREQIQILDHQNLQDGFNNKWEPHILSQIIKDSLAMWNIDTVITFDNYGVSGHPNHRDVHHAVRKLMHEKLPREIEAWELISMSIFRKYSGPASVWPSLLCYSSYQKKEMHLLLNSSPYKSYRAMAQHKSQWVWFRKLFVVFSSYTYVNTLHKIS